MASRRRTPSIVTLSSALVILSGKFASAAQLLAKPRNRVRQALGHLDLGFPAQNMFGLVDIRLAHLGVVLRAHILGHDPSLIAGKLVDHFGKLANRILSWLPMLTGSTSFDISSR